MSSLHRVCLLFVALKFTIFITKAIGQEVDECARNGTCGRNAICVSAPRGHHCICERGYVGDGYTCLKRQDDDDDQCPRGKKRCPGDKKKHCIPEYKFCDGVQDCRRGTDEDPEYCRNKNRNCPPGEKKCPGCTRCIKKHQFCDGVIDCDDGSDEAYYVCRPRSAKATRPMPQKYRFDASLLKTASRKYQRLLARQEQEFKKRYRSKSVDRENTETMPGVAGESQTDEKMFRHASLPETFAETQSTGPEMQEFTCKRDHDRCPYRAKCIPVCDFCDGENDCGDWSDEDPEFCRGWQCPDNYVRCYGSRQCMYKAMFCNNINNCRRGSDEAKQICGD